MTSITQRLIFSFIICLLVSCGGGGSDNNSPIQSGSKDNTNTPDNSASNILPRIYIDTEGKEAIANTEDYQGATIRVLSADGAEELSAATKIRGRGNTTWGLPKKPYRLKLDQAASLLGLPAERNWALLANYADKTLVRTKLAMDLGEKAGLTYNPRSKFFELYFNGDYQGVYQLSEHVEVSPNRVNVQKLDPEADTGNITGGYFMEIDHRLDEDVCWRSSMGIPFCFKDPEYKTEQIDDPTLPASAQFNYITGYINSAEQSIRSGGNGYRQYLDADSMVSYYLVQEMMKNNDAQINADGQEFKFTSSVFLYKPRDGKLHFGPLWDFDIAAGNINYNGNDDPEGWWVRNSLWFNPLFADPNSDFGQRVFSKWCQLRNNGTISGLGAQVDSIVAGIDPAAIQRNFQKWDILGKQAFVETYIGQTYQDETTYLKNWLNKRAAWMNNALVQQYGECPGSAAFR